MPDLPVMCTLSPAALEARRKDLLGTLARRALDRQELSDGLRLRFAPEGDILLSIAGIVDVERLCCQFLRFCVTVEPGGGPISLDLTGPPGTREFVSALIG